MSNGLPIPILIHEKSQIFLSIKITSFTSKWYYWWWLSIESINLLFLPIKWILETYTMSWNFFLGEHLLFFSWKDFRSEVLDVSEIFLTCVASSVFSSKEERASPVLPSVFVSGQGAPRFYLCVTTTSVFVSPEERVSSRTQFFYRRLLLPALSKQDWCDSRVLVAFTYSIRFSGMKEEVGTLKKVLIFQKSCQKDYCLGS